MMILDDYLPKELCSRTVLNMMTVTTTVTMLKYEDDQNQSDLEEGNDWGEMGWKIVLN